MAYKKPAIEIVKAPRLSRINMVGVELEGIWGKPPAGVEWVGHTPPAAGQLGRDGSLDPLHARYPDKPYCGELPSPPMPEADLPAWMRKHWPSIVGPECGLHVHISLKNDLLYMKLMDDEAYPATVIKYLTLKAKEEKIPDDDPIWPRLRGESTYCQHVHMPDAQVNNKNKDYEKHRPGHRYTAINFCYSRKDLGTGRLGPRLGEDEKRPVGTIECRVLSMTKDVEVGIRMAQEFIRVTNGFLLATGAKKEKKKVSTYELRDAPHRDRLTVRV